MLDKCWAKLSLLLTFVSFVLLIVGLSSPVWLSRNGHYEGIWIYCYYLIHTQGDIKCLVLDKLADFSVTGNWLKAVRALMILSVIATFVSTVCHILYIVARRRSVGLKLLHTAIILASLSAILCVSGLIIYATRVRIDILKEDYVIGWSFILCAVGGGVMAGVILPLLVEIKNCRLLASYETIT
ncbi:Peroxisomal membrane protein pmp22 [Mactra antiquata]